MRLVVTGTNGQVARALQALAAPGFDVIALGRPQLDLTQPESIAHALAAAQPDVVINAAAYTAVDKAESERDAAFAANAAGARAVAEAAAACGAPIVQLSTDYVFDGSQPEPYTEADPVAPINAYGASKLAGEVAVGEVTPNHAIVRFAWVYAPFGANFVRTMLRLTETREEVSVVADQRGRPTSALDIAAGLAQIAANLAARPDDARLRGVFHMGPQGEATWAEFAEAIFAGAAERGARAARVRPIPSSDYPTPARRPANSRLDSTKLAAAHGVVLPHWRHSLSVCLDRLITEQTT